MILSQLVHYRRLFFFTRLVQLKHYYRYMINNISIGQSMMCAPDTFYSRITPKQYLYWSASCSGDIHYYCCVSLVRCLVYSFSRSFRSFFRQHRSAHAPASHWPRPRPGQRCRKKKHYCQKKQYTHAPAAESGVVGAIALLFARYHRRKRRPFARN